MPYGSSRQRQCERVRVLCVSEGSRGTTAGAGSQHGGMRSERGGSRRCNSSGGSVGNSRLQLGRAAGRVSARGHQRQPDMQQLTRQCGQ